MKPFRFAAMAAVFATLLCLPLRAGAARLTPWESPQMPIYVAETFESFADGNINALTEPFWSGTGHSTGTFPFYAEWNAGRLVFTGNNTGFSDIIRINAPGMNAAAEVGKQAAGMGFYLENNSAAGQQLDFYMIGEGCYSLGSSAKGWLYSLQGEKTEQIGFATVPAGFKGYFVCFMANLNNLWNSGAPWGGTDSISMPGFDILSLELAEGETFVIDNVFYFGEDLQNKQAELIQVITPTPTPLITATALVATPAPTSTAASPGAPSNAFWWIITGVCSLGSIFMAVLLAADIHKNKKNKNSAAPGENE